MPLHPSAGPLRVIAAASLLATAQAQAFEVPTGVEDLQVRWDNTVKYSVGARLKDRLPALSTTAPAAPNQNDGDNNFGKGLVQNRFDLLSEFDAKYRNVGVRLSGAAWYDRVYTQTNDNTTATANRPVGQPANVFPDETRKLMGHYAELLDAFVFAQLDVNDRPLTVRAGRHTMLWGESLFFAGNSIAGGQAPVDVIKAQSVPGSTTKEIVRPTGKVSLQMQVADDLSVAAYVPYEWEKSRLMPVGSYLSSGDSAGPGGERNITPFGSFTIVPEKDAKNTGQGGVSLRWRADALDADIGFHAIRFHQTGPSNLYLRWNGVPGNGGVPQTLQWQYHEGTRAYGISMAKTVGEWSLGAEVSMRDSQPLASNGLSVITLPNGAVLNGTYNNSDNPGYAVGRTAHAQFNWLASLSPSALYQEASFLGEVAWNRRLKYTAGEAFADPLATRDAAAIRLQFAPTYRQVLDGLDLSIPLGVSYTAGRSSALAQTFGPDRGGDVNVGLQGTYLARWNLGLAYVHYYGPAGPTLNASQQIQFKQTLKDRDFVTLSVRTTF
jgi:hypothetical protein